MRGHLAVGIALAAVAMIARPAAAADNIFGTTGLITIPTAHVLDPREAELHVHPAEDFLSYGASLGVFRGLEVGATLLKGDFLRVVNGNGKTVALIPDNSLGASGEQEVLINAKYEALHEHAFVPAVAVGVTDLFSTEPAGTSFYAVASKTLIRATPLNKLSVTAHAGWGTGFYEEEFFLGAEVGLGFPFTMASFGLPLSLIADMSADHKVSAGARVRLPAGFGIEANWIREKSFGGAVNFKHGF